MLIRPSGPDWELHLIRHFAVALIFTLVFAAHAVSAAGVTYYVRTSGDEANDGLTPETARASLRQTARLLQSPGDRLIAGPGVYHEGNIKPRGSGTADDPIAFLADTSGSLTHDPPGTVTIVPANTFDATTGFIVYGRHDILIEGFTIEGASDAGIQVRPHSRTGVDSSRVTARNNIIRNGRHRGIHMIAVGDVAVLGNTMTGNGSGLILAGGASGAMRPRVSGNTITDNRHGIGIQHTFGGSLVENEVRGRGRGVYGFDNDGLTVVDNEIITPNGRSLQVSGDGLVVIYNVLERGGEVGGGRDGLVFDRNRFPNEEVGLRLSAAGNVSVTNNQLPNTIVSSGSILKLEGNTTRVLKASSSGALAANDNQFINAARLSAATELELKRNRAAAYLEVQASDAWVDENEIGGVAFVSADRGTITDNRANTLMIRSRSPRYHSVDEGGHFFVGGNATQGTLRVGGAGLPLSSANVTYNMVGGRLHALVRHTLEVGQNEASGIACVLTAPDADLVLADNTSRHSDGGGLVVIGAQNALVENNTASENADSGLATRRTEHLTISGNRLSANAAGGVSVLAPVDGDCNGDLTVSIDEVVMAIDVVLGNRPRRDCKAADVNGDGVVKIDELLMSVLAALDQSAVHRGDVALYANHVEHNGRFGVNVFATGPVVATDNQVLQNHGIAMAVHARTPQDGIEIVGNVLGLANAEGMLVDGVVDAQIRNNVVFSNGQAGILLRDAPGTAIVNNLIYANGNDGIAVGAGSTRPTSHSLIMNNTLYANAGWGVTVGNRGVPSTEARIINNLVLLNERGGVAAEFDSLPELMIGFNLNNDRYEPNIVPGVTDFSADPRFVAPAGPDGVLGSTGFADDDFHVHAERPRSAAIDAGSATATSLGITGSSVIGQESDVGIVDLGYHYGAEEW